MTTSVWAEYMHPCTVDVTETPNLQHVELQDVDLLNDSALAFNRARCILAEAPVKGITSRYVEIGAAVQERLLSSQSLLKRFCCQLS